MAARVFEALAEAGVNVDMIVQSSAVIDSATIGHTDISFTLPELDLPLAQPMLEDLGRQIGAGGVDCDSDIAKISVIGAGMKSNWASRPTSSARSRMPESISRSSRPRRSGSLASSVRARWSAP